MKINHYAYIAAIYLSLIGPCLGGEAIGQLSDLNTLSELGVPHVEAMNRLGSNTVERCKNDRNFLISVRDRVMEDALRGDTLAALVFAVHLKSFDPQTGRNMLERMAARGDTDAMTLLGAIYCKDDAASAVRWLMKAMNKGDADAADILTVEYESNLSKEQYIECLNVLVKDKRPRGYLHLSAAYAAGDGVEIDSEKAAELLLEAWDEGVVPAGLMLALLYMDTDKELAMEWMHKGALAGDHITQFEWGMVLLKEDKPNDAVGWFEKSAAQGNIQAQCMMGEMYFSGNGVAADEKVAYEWTEKAALQGDPWALNTMGRKYLYAEDWTNAYKWLSAAKEFGHVGAAKTIQQLKPYMNEHELAEGKVKAEKLLDYLRTIGK